MRFNNDRSHESFSNAQKQIKAACDQLGLEPAVYEILSSR